MVESEIFIVVIYRLQAVALCDMLICMHCKKGCISSNNDSGSKIEVKIEL